MVAIIHEIDPSADTVIVLKNPNAPFAVWNEDSVIEDVPIVSPAEASNERGDFQQLDPPSPVRKMTKKQKLKLLRRERENKAAEGSVPSEHILSERTGAADSELDGGEQPEISVAGPSSQVDVEKPGQPAIPIKEDEEEDEGIRYHVSSRHLALASGFFKTSLSRNGWIEGQPNTADGMYHLSTADWDPQALLILLRVLHLRNRMVPRSLTLEMLTKVAVLVDYYRCGEAVELFSQMWVDAARKSSPVPPTYGRELVLWMCIAWVFKLPSEFKQTTDIAFRQSKSPTIQDMCLPIPMVVLGKSTDSNLNIYLLIDG
jgi:hypothetical protein